MPNNPQKKLDRINRVISAWETLRPAKSFAGMTLAQFREKIAPSLDARTALAQAEAQITAAKNQRIDADRVSEAAIQLVTHAVKGDPEEGDDGELYDAMGFVRRSERRSGLRRPRRVVQPVAA